MSIVMLLLVLAGVGAALGILYGAYKLYQSAVVDDEIAAQEAIVQAAARTAAYQSNRSPLEVKSSEQIIEDFLSTRRPRK